MTPGKLVRPKFVSVISTFKTSNFITVFFNPILGFGKPSKEKKVQNCGHHTLLGVKQKTANCCCFDQLSWILGKKFINFQTLQQCHTSRRFIQLGRRTY